MFVSDLNPLIRYARVHKTSLRMNDDVHICYDCRFFYMDNISGSININGKEYDILNKTAIFIPPETEYMFNTVFHDNSKAVIIDFDLTNENALIQESLGTAFKSNFDKMNVPPYTLPDELSSPIVRAMPQLDRMLNQCAENFLYKQLYYKERSSALLKLCLIELVVEKSENAYTEICDTVISYIHTNYSNPALTNQMIAEKFNYHPNHLSAIIKRETGRTLHNYLIYYRLQIAKNYLLTTQYGISDIAWCCGFCSEAYFIKQFKANTGYTPKVYRRYKIQAEL